MIVIGGGQVLTSRGWMTANVIVEDGRVTAITPGVVNDADIDATGCLVGPGFVDMHTHLRDPGQTWKEDMASGSAAAVTGGFTAITAMPNTEPPIDSPKVVEAVLAAAEEVGLVDVIPSAALTAGRAGVSPTDVEELYQAGVRVFTDDGDSVSDTGVLDQVMHRIATLPGAMVAQHAEDRSLTRGGHIHDGIVARKLGLTGLPSRAETDIVRRDLDLAARTGARYHCQHVSAKMTIELIRTAKDSGLSVTAEVTPHHLSFDESSLGSLDTDFKMYPPLRSSDDREALVEALRDGTIDVVATDHAPHLPEEKRVGFAEAPRGVIGLETAASATWEALGDRDLLFQRLSLAPAKILGLTAHGQPVAPGVMANLVVFDTASSWVADEFASKSSNSPYSGRAMQGQVRATVHRGQVAFEDGAVVA